MFSNHGGECLTDPRSIDYANATSGPMDQGSVLVGVGFIACNLPYFATTRICPTLSKFYDRARVNEVLSLPEVLY